MLRLQELMRRHRFVVHLDIRAYFPSIDLDILRALLAHRIRDRRFLAVVDLVLDSGRGIYEQPAVRRHARLTAAWPPDGRGLPIGASTSQALAAHLYLQAFDHWVKRGLKVRGYVRYVDDFFLFGDRRAELRRRRTEVGSWLMEHRGLRLKHPNARVLSCHGHLDALGHRVARSAIRPRERALRRMAARARGGRRGTELARSVASSAGVVMFGAAGDRRGIAACGGGGGDRAADGGAGGEITSRAEV